MLTGERVVLRPPRSRDAALFVAAASASAEFHAPWVRAPADHDQFQSYVRRTRRPDQLGYLVTVGDELAGVVNVNNIIFGGLCSGFLGYYALAGFERQGLMTEAVSLVVGHAFGSLDLHRLEANIQPGNEPSKALVRRLGFRREGFSPRYLRIDGEWRDHERWAITAEDMGPPDAVTARVAPADADSGPRRA